MCGYLTLLGERAGLYSGTYGLFLVVLWNLAGTVLSFWAIAIYLEAREKQKSQSISSGNSVASFSTYSVASEKAKLELETRNKDIQSNQDRLKSVFAASPNLVFIINRDGFFEFINKRFETVFHVDGALIHGKTGVGYLPREVAASWTGLDRSILDQGQTLSSEQKVRQDDGLSHTYFITKFPLLDETGRPRAICGIGTDITDIKDYQNYLIQEKIKEEAILNSVGDGIVATDSNGKLLLLNKACEEMTGCSACDIEGASWTQVVRMESESGQVVEESARPLTQALTQKKKIISSDSYYVKKDGTRFPVSIIATPVIFEDKVIGAVGTFRDITREKELERAKDDFVSMVSHELKAPMTAIRGGLAVVLKGDYGELSGGLKSVLSRMFDYMGRLLNLSESILKVSKIESGALKVNPVAVNVDALISDVYVNLKILADKKKIKLQKGDISSREVSGDSILIGEILTNLVNNAAKFTAAGSVKIYTKENGGFLDIYVQDTGAGIPEDEQGKLFGKFQQISSSLGRPEGTGLGLYLSRGMARQMGGDLRLFDSREGEGSTFVLSLPLASLPKVS